MDAGQNTRADGPPSMPVVGRERHATTRGSSGRWRAEHAPAEVLGDAGEAVLRLLLVRVRGEGQGYGYGQ